MATTSSPTPFIPPPYTTFPPFYTLQPNHQTLTHQLDLWSSLILAYCTHHNLHKLSLSSLPPALFTSSNPTTPRSLKPADIRAVLEHMALPSNGARIEWLGGSAGGRSGGQAESCWVWTRTPNEWADAIYGWVEETGQRSSVLTLYEIKEGEGKREWRGMEEAMVRKVLGVLVKRGKAQVFQAGQGDGEGVKFF